MGEDQRLGAGLLVFGVGNKLLVIHLTQDRLLPLFVVGFIIEGIIVGGQIGDAGDGGTFGQTELRNILSEIRLGSRLHAIASLPEVGNVEIPLHDLFLVVTLFQLQCAEDLCELSLHRYFIMARHIFQHLLCDGGTSVGLAHGEKHVHQSAGGTVPVHPFVVIKAFVLNGNYCLFHIGRDLFIVDPLAVLQPRQRDQLLERAGTIIIPYGAGLVDLIVLQGNIELGGKARLYIVGKNAGEEHAGKEKHDQHRTTDL